jgi:hypothetical protein
MRTIGPTVAVSAIPLAGELHIRKDSHPVTWEFSVKDPDEVAKYPGYPITHRVTPEGIPITLEHESDKCPAAFHGYGQKSRYGEHFYIGSARRLGVADATGLYKQFLTRVFDIKVGVDTATIPVWVQPLHGNTVRVSRR